MADIREVHEAALANVQLKIDQYEMELGRLRPVAAYHKAELAHYEGKMSPLKPKEEGRPPSKMGTNGSVAISEVLSYSKHDAAKYVLEREQRPMKIGEIVDWLVRIGYGTNLTRKVLFNSLFTAMRRKSETFRAVTDSKWELVK